MLKRILLLMIGLMIAVVMGTAVWYFNRPLPQPISEQPIFEGISYSRIVDRDVPLVYHIISIDLTQPDLRFFATPADDIVGFDYAARTTSGFLEEYDLQLAINGDFFDPWFAYSPWNYYPKVGDGVNARGLSMTDGVTSAAGYAPDLSATLYITSDNEVSFTQPDVPIQTAISGNIMIVEDSAYTITEDNDFLNKRHPRTAVALNESGDTMLLFVIDGRQPNYSHGASMPELADIIIRHGGYTAINLDGGGSVAMVMADVDGNPTLLNSPIHTRIPYHERPVANHFGVYALPLSIPMERSL